MQGEKLMVRKTGRCTTKRLKDVLTIRMEKVRNQIQSLYDKEFERALCAHNRNNPEHKWKKMKTGSSRIINIPSLNPDDGGFVKIKILLSRVQICGMRGKGSTFVFLGSMLLPRSHFLTGQVASYLLSFLRRKDKSLSLGQWCNQHLDADLTISMLKRAFDRLCASLRISFGERPSKLYRLAQKCQSIELKITGKNAE